MSNKHGMPNVLRKINAERRLANEGRNNQIVEMRIAGLSERAIAKEIGISYAQVGRIINAHYEVADKLKVKNGNRVLEVELDRLDKLTLALFANKSDPRTADTLLRIMERRSKYLGLDSPIKVDNTNRQSGELKVKYDFSKVPDQDLDMMLAIIEKAEKGEGE